MVEGASRDGSSQVIASQGSQQEGQGQDQGSRNLLAYNVPDAGYPPWCKKLARQYVEASRNPSVEDSAAWLLRTAATITDPQQKRRVIFCTPYHFYHYEWSRAVTDAIRAMRDRSKALVTLTLDPDVYAAATARALSERKELVDWLDEAVREKLAR